jgi:hypothetical protein
LHADADAEKRSFRRQNSVFERRDQAVDGVEAGHTGSEGADPRQDDAISGGDFRRVGFDGDARRETAFARGALKRLLDRAQIARSAVDNDDVLAHCAAVLRGQARKENDANGNGATRSFSANSNSLKKIGPFNLRVFLTENRLHFS